MKLKIAALIIMTTVMVKSVDAQSKIGHVSVQEIVNNMPEYKAALTELDDFEKALIDLGKEYNREYNRQDSLFAADSSKWTPAMKEVKRKELNAAYLKVLNFNQDAQNQMNQKEQQLLAPVQQKAIQTAQLVAKENGYAYVLPKEQLIAFPASEDILPLVLKKLNITPPASTNPAPKKN